jgi:hypothetical protein
VGYEFHITRAENWVESDQRPITAEEWLAVVAADPELRIDEENGPYFAVWSGPCSYEGGGWFDWSDGCISTKNPDRAILGKMLRLATQLGAVVQGDDGEVYSEASQLSDDLSANDQSVLRRQRFIRIAGLVILTLSAAWLIFKMVRWALSL